MSLSPHLTPDERAVARRLWESLVFRASRSAAETARQQLMAAPPHIQQAIINEIAGPIRQYTVPEPDQNPFALYPYGLFSHFPEG